MRIKFGNKQIWETNTCIQNYDKKMFFIESCIVALLMIAYLTNVSGLVFVSFCLICFLILISGYRESIYYLAFFTSFAGILVYQERHLYFVIIILFILKGLFGNKVKKDTFLYFVFILFYSLIFSDFGGNYSFAKIIGLVLFFAVPVIADSAADIDYNDFMRHYIFGFTFETVIGYFVMSIPSMRALFAYDLMWTANYQELTRFFGLAFDCNFYALSNYVVVSYLLFSFDKITRFRGILIIFFVLSGLQTVSKSYLLVLGLLLVFYLIRNIRYFKKIIIALAVGIIGIGCFIYVSDKIGYNVLELILERFVKGSFADNTTGRVDIWNNYLKMFEQAGIKELLFGFGFNATVERAAHNTFIELIFHFGLIGFALWVVYFINCAKKFFYNANGFNSRTPIVLISLLLGAFFLSAYTYEAFWIGIVIAFMNFGIRNREGVLGADV